MTQQPSTPRAHRAGSSRRIGIGICLLIFLSATIVAATTTSRAHDMASRVAEEAKKHATYEYLMDYVVGPLKRVRIRRH